VAFVAGGALVLAFSAAAATRADFIFWFFVFNAQGIAEFLTQFREVVFVKDKQSSMSKLFKNLASGN
jgi:hypothetical protein